MVEEVSDDWIELIDPFEIEDVCDAISFNFRVHVMRVLKKHGGKLSLAELRRKCAEDKEFDRQYYVVQKHVDKMATDGVVKLSKDEGGEYEVRLLKEIRVFVRELKDG